MDPQKTKQAISIFDKYAEMYQDKYMSVEKYHDSLDVFCSKLPAEGNVLELACGPGNITQYLFKTKPNLSILATDLSPEMLKLAKNNNPNAYFKKMDCRTFMELETKFDGILCGFGLPYISKEDALQMIRDASKSLNQDGVLYLSTMEDKYSNSSFTASSTDPNDGLYTYYHEGRYLFDEMVTNGFEILVEDRVKYLDESKNEVTDLILIGQLSNQVKN